MMQEKSMNQRSMWLSPVLAVALMVVFSSSVSAGGLTVLGGKIETTVQSGRDYSYSMQVQNTSSDPMDLVIEIEGYGTGGKSPFLVLDPEEDISQYSARECLSVSPADFQLGVGESRVVTVSVRIPEVSEAAGKYAIVYIHTVPKVGSVATISGIAARVLLTIEGLGANHFTEINSVDIVEGNVLQAQVELTNTGNHHYKPHIQGTLRKGDIILAQASVDDIWPLIPHFSRQFELIFAPSGTLPAGPYNVDIEVMDESASSVARETSVINLESDYHSFVGLPPASSPAVQTFLPPPVKIVLNPSEGARLANKDDSITIDFPRGAVISQVPLTLESSPSETPPPVLNDYQMSNINFHVKGLNGLLAKEAMVTVKYAEAELQRAGGDPSRLVLVRWDEVDKGWTVLDTSVDQINLTLTAKTVQFGIWAVLIGPARTSSVTIYLVVGGACILLLSGFLLIRSKRKWFFKNKGSAS
jgi:hypothetical protein